MWAATGHASLWHCAGYACLRVMQHHSTATKPPAHLCRVPVAYVTMTQGGQALSMTRSIDGYWLLESGGPFSFPASVTVQSIFGDMVTDTVPGGPVGTFAGGAQFPLSAQYPTIGSAGAPCAYCECS